MCNNSVESLIKIFLKKNHLFFTFLMFVSIYYFFFNNVCRSLVKLILAWIICNEKNVDTNRWRKRCREKNHWRYKNWMTIKVIRRSLCSNVRTWMRSHSVQNIRFNFLSHAHSTRWKQQRREVKFVKLFSVSIRCSYSIPHWYAAIFITYTMQWNGNRMDILIQDIETVTPIKWRFSLSNEF